MMFQSSLLGNGMVFKSKSNDIYEEFCMINRSCSHIMEWTVEKINFTNNSRNVD